MEVKNLFSRFKWEFKTRNQLYLKNELSYEVYFLHVIRHTYLIQSIHMGVVRLTW